MNWREKVEREKEQIHLPKIRRGNSKIPSNRRRAIRRDKEKKITLSDNTVMFEYDHDYK